VAQYTCKTFHIYFTSETPCQKGSLLRQLNAPRRQNTASNLTYDSKHHHLQTPYHHRNQRNRQIPLHFNNEAKHNPNKVYCSTFSYSPQGPFPMISTTLQTFTLLALPDVFRKRSLPIGQQYAILPDFHCKDYRIPDCLFYPCVTL